MTIEGWERMEREGWMWDGIDEEERRRKEEKNEREEWKEYQKKKNWSPGRSMRIVGSGSLFPVPFFLSFKMILFFSFFLIFFILFFIFPIFFLSFLSISLFLYSILCYSIIISYLIIIKRIPIWLEVYKHILWGHQFSIHFPF